MKKNVIFSDLCLLCLTIFVFSTFQSAYSMDSNDNSSISETKANKEKRMSWWTDARFGMFIHWGLYAVPAGQWNGSTNHAEWILNSAKIPVNEYEKFAPQFNPTKFDPVQWVSMAKNAGMKYIVITSKHHDGFCLWDSKLTDYDVMDATPFKRDILKEIADQCRKQGLKICFYHSIMDWHNPDYLPRRDWETRSAVGADFNRYKQYLKGQIAELIKNYGPVGVLWFDGEWENTWAHRDGLDLYKYVKSLQPDIIINNRVDKGRQGMAGMTKDPNFAGDFGTPELEIPQTGLPGVYWESCMTMTNNNHWGYNKNDVNFISSKNLIRNLIDTASKGGNLLLNIGPKPDGTFPQQSIDRLADIGKWMSVNSQSIYGTSASTIPNLPWGRCTAKADKIYLHIFDWPADSKLVIQQNISNIDSAYLLVDLSKKLSVEYKNNSTVISVPDKPLDPVATVIVLEFKR
jgi:alpha-L-fucosidase